MKFYCFFAGAFALMSSSAFSDTQALSGSWVTECMTAPGGARSIEGKVDISRHKITSVRRFFLDKDCKVLNSTIQTAAKITNLAAGNLDWIPTQVTRTANAPAVVDYYNSNKMCGYSDWTLNQPKDIAGKVCKPFKSPELNATVHDYYRLSSGQLTLGHFPNRSVATDPGLKIPKVNYSYKKSE